jgi:hypothetical protein
MHTMVIAPPMPPLRGQPDPVDQRPTAPPRSSLAPGLALVAVLAALALQAGLLGGLIVTARDWPARLPWAVALMVLASLPLPLAVWGLAWLPSRRTLVVLLGGAVLLRALLLPLPPLLSTDVHRFLWDGRVVAHGLNPYGVPPTDPRLARLRDGHQQQVNHAQLPTIYPPVAQLIFGGVVRAGGGLTALKAVLAAVDLGALLLLVALLGKGRTHLAVLWAWHPLAVVEIALAGHVDGVGVALVLAALWLAVRGRRIASGLVLGAAGGVKVILVVLAPLLRAPRALLACALCVTAILVPFALAGPRAFDGIEAVARRWRMNPSAYSVVHGAVYRAVVRPEGSRAHIPAGPVVERLVGGRGWDHVLADDIASFAARSAAVLAVLGTLAVVLRRRLSPERGALWVLGVLLAVSPTVHPWYVLWILPLAVQGRSVPWLLFASLIPLTYLPLGEYLRGGEWRTDRTVQVLIYAVLYGGLLSDLGWRATFAVPGGPDGRPDGRIDERA